MSPSINTDELDVQTSMNICNRRDAEKDTQAGREHSLTVPSISMLAYKGQSNVCMQYDIEAALTTWNALQDLPRTPTRSS